MSQRHAGQRVMAVCVCWTVEVKVGFLDFWGRGASVFFLILGEGGL